LNSQVENYGWVKDQCIHSHSYIQPIIVETCRSLGVRRVLDLGCGKGDIAGALAEAGFNVVGCDADAEGIRLAAQTYPKARFVHTGVYDDPASFGDDRFDAVVSTEVVEHLFAPRALPRFASQVLKPGGRLIVTTPYHGYLKNLLLAVTNHWDRHLSPLWDGGHIKFFSRQTLEQLLTEGGFTVREFRGLGRFPFVWKSMLLVAQKNQPGE
jgi:2-polyprenyl-3-methyl-5-hydroxy-6-metoxy-1,4-benzoquinol methylase